MYRYDIKKIICIISLVFITTEISAQTTYYIDAVNGNDNNSGNSESAAWKTYNQVAKFIAGWGGEGTARNGDKFLFKRGQTHLIGATKITGDPDDGVIRILKDNLYFGVYGTGAKPILDGQYTTIRFFNSEASDPGFHSEYHDLVFKHHAFWNGDYIRYGMIRLSADRNSFVIDGCEFYGLNDDKTNGSHHIVTGNNWGSGIVITNNIFDGTWMEHGIYGSGGGNGMRVEHNIFRNMGYKPDYYNSIAFKTRAYHNGSNERLTNFKFRYNHIYNCQDGVATFAGIDNGDISYNIFELSNHTVAFSNQSDGVTTGGAHDYDVTINTKFYNNTFIIHDNSSVASMFEFHEVALDGVQAPANCEYGIELFNNLYYIADNSSNAHGNIYIGIYTNHVDLSRTTFRNNIYYDSNEAEQWWRFFGTEINNEKYLGDTFNEWKNRTGLDKVESTWGEDPELVNPNPVNGDFTLRSSSPAINAGYAGGVHTFDFNGNSISGTPDIGAFEYQSEPQLLAPVADFIVDNITNETDQTVIFTDASQNSPTKHQWSFDPASVTFMDGTSSTTKNVRVQFNEPGSYSVKLTVSNSVGQDEKLETNLITVFDPAPELGVKFDLFAFLAGCFENGSLKTDLNSRGFLSSSQPFSIAPWNYLGKEEVVSGFSDDIVDWVLIELRADQNSTTKIDEKACLIKETGKITGLDRSDIFFPNLASGDYYILIHHRNHLSVMSSEKIHLSSTISHYDFRDSQSKAYGSEAMQNLGNGNFGLYSGDGNSDGEISNDDIQQIWIPEFLNSVDGYLQGDFNRDGSVTASDNNIYWLPNNGKKITFQK